MRVFLIIIIATFLFVSCSALQSQYYEGSSFAMNTIISQEIYGDNAEESFTDVNKRIKEIENNMTVKDLNSDIGKINEASANASKNYTLINRDTALVIEKAVFFSDKSNGAFDVTIKPLIDLWNISGIHSEIPSDEEIKDTRYLVDYRGILIKNEGKKTSVRLEMKNQAIDLGGIAKGYACDEAIKIYKDKNIESALINIGGNISALGTKPDKTQWKIGVQNPRGETGTYIGVVSLKDNAISTSGDYQRFFELDGKKYHHIIDPETGYPAKSGLISVSVISKFAVDADALSTAVFVLGLEKGKSLIEELDNTEAVFITDEKQVLITSGLKNKFEFSDQSGAFTYIN